MSDDLANWAARRADDLIARAEAAAVAELKAALLSAVAARQPSSSPATPAPRDSVSTARARRGTLVWAYFVTRASEWKPVPVPGLEAQHIERIERAGLAVAVSRVPASKYGEESLQVSLNDLTWLERTARAHEAVLERASEQTTIVPLRLCTIFNDEGAVAHMLHANTGAFIEALDHLAGRQEWSVKLLVDRERLEDAEADGDDAATDVGSGAAYLLGRRAERDRRAAAERLGRELAENVHARLQDWAIDAVVNPPQSRELSGHVGEMLLNGAYLVEAARAGELHALAAELEEHHEAVGARIVVTGPLPPFNFVPRERAPSP